MKTKLPTKADLREELEQQVNAYLQRGGNVQNVANGVSGRYGNEGDGPLQMGRGDGNGPREERTYVPDVVAAIEERRQQMVGTRSRPGSATHRKPRKKLIYDDFGEPLRWRWEE